MSEKGFARCGIAEHGDLNRLSRCTHYVGRRHNGEASIVEQIGDEFAESAIVVLRRRIRRRDDLPPSAVMLQIAAEVVLLEMLPVLRVILGRRLLRRVM